MLTFESLGRTRQARIRTAEDLERVLELDDALWVATAAPVDTLRLDPVFLAWVDSDSDGRIRSDELRGAIRWLFGVLLDRSAVAQASDALSLADIDRDHPDGHAILDAARRILLEIGEPSANTLPLDAIRRVRAAEEARGLSAAGKVLPAAGGDDAELVGFLEHVLEVTGGEQHPSGRPAVTGAALDRFLTEGRAWLGWYDEQATDAAVLPLGERTAAAAAALGAVADKLDQYFLLCDAVALDPGVADRNWIDPATDLLDPAVAARVLEKAPIARPRPDAVLDLDDVINPAWRARVRALVDEAAQPLLGGPVHSLDRDAVARIRERLARYETWRAGEPEHRSGSRGPEALRQHLDRAHLAERTRALLARSEVAAVALDGVKLVERVVLYQRFLMRLVHSLVSMPELFDGDRKAPFERGTLVMDGRVFDLAFPVNDPERAERFAAMSPMFTMFVRVGVQGDALDEEVAVPVTAGSRGHLVDGMWGVFYDVDGNERHAQVRRIIVSPISIREAVLLPFRRLGDAVQSMFDRAAESQQKNLTKALKIRAESARGGEGGEAAQPVPAEAPAPSGPSPSGPSPFGQLPLLLAGLGVAFGAIGAVMVQAIEMFMGASSKLAAALVGLPFMHALPPWTQTALSVAALPSAIALVLMGLFSIPLSLYLVPVTIAAWLRLRRRDLATLLEGSGWAVNARLYLDHRLAVRVTRRPSA